jgi:hypothetical protein
MKPNPKPSRPGSTPLAMSLDAMAKLLSLGAGQSITTQMIQKDLAEGAPVNGDGTVNLIRYAAWLAYHVN